MSIIKDLRLRQGKATLTTLIWHIEPALTALASDSRIWEQERESYQMPSVFKEKWFEKAMVQMDKGKRWPFFITWGDELAGSSSYYDIDPKNKRLNIGYTWYHPQFWGTELNVTAKFLLLRHAFEQLGYVRVAFSVDPLNIRSCRALEKLGAQKEGVLRKHLLRQDGTYRNSVIFAITDDDWPAIKSNLEEMISGEYEHR